MQDDLSSAQISINSPEKQKTIPVDGNFPIILIYLLHLKKYINFQRHHPNLQQKRFHFSVSSIINSFSILIQVTS